MYAGRILSLIIDLTLTILILFLIKCASARILPSTYNECLFLVMDTLKLVTGIVVLCKKDKYIKVYLWLIVITGFMRIVLAIRELKNVVINEHIWFGICTGIIIAYYPYSLMLIYSHWQNVKDQIDITIAIEYVKEIDGKAKKIVEDVGLSVIPETAETDEISISL